MIFRTWSDGLPADVEVCPVQLPGRGTRLMERPFTRLPPLVEALAQALVPLLDKPFAFFGHSLGALVSFELARRTAGACMACSPFGCLFLLVVRLRSLTETDRSITSGKRIFSGTAPAEWHSQRAYWSTKN